MKGGLGGESIWEERGLWRGAVWEGLGRGLMLKNQFVGHLICHRINQ